MGALSDHYGIYRHFLFQNISETVNFCEDYVRYLLGNSYFGFTEILVQLVIFD